MAMLKLTKLMLKKQLILFRKTNEARIEMSYLLNLFEPLNPYEQITYPVICNFAKSYRNENDTGAQKSLSEQRYRVLQGQAF